MVCCVTSQPWNLPQLWHIYIYIVTWLLLSWGRSCPYLALTPSTSPLVKLQSAQAPLPTSFIINTCTALFKAGLVWGGLSCSSSPELQHSIPWLLPTLPRQGCPRHHFPPSPTGQEWSLSLFPHLHQPGLAAGQ